MTTSATRTDSQSSLPKGLVCLEFLTKADKQNFLEKYCKELPPERCGNIPSRRLIKNAKVIEVDKDGLPRKIDQLKPVLKEIPQTASAFSFAGKIRVQRMKKQ